MRAGNVGFINRGRVGRGASPALREADNSRERRFIGRCGRRPTVNVKPVSTLRHFF